MGWGAGLLCGAAMLAPLAASAGDAPTLDLFRRTCLTAAPSFDGLPGLATAEGGEPWTEDRAHLLLYVASSASHTWSHPEPRKFLVATTSGRLDDRLTAGRSAVGRACLAIEQGQSPTSILRGEAEVIRAIPPDGRVLDGPVEPRSDLFPRLSADRVRFYRTRLAGGPATIVISWIYPLGQPQAESANMALTVLVDDGAAQDTSTAARR